MLRTSKELAIKSRRGKARRISAASFPGFELFLTIFSPLASSIPDFFLPAASPETQVSLVCVTCGRNERTLSKRQTNCTSLEYHLRYMIYITLLRCFKNNFYLPLYWSTEYPLKLIIRGVLPHKLNSCSLLQRADEMNRVPSPPPTVGREPFRGGEKMEIQGVQRQPYIQQGLKAFTSQGFLFDALYRINKRTWREGLMTMIFTV